MIDLSIQFKLILFSFVFGFLFSFVIELFNSFVKKFSKLLKIILSFFVVLFMSVIYFIGILKIGNAIFHIFSVFSIIIGFLSYDGIIKIIANNNKK